MPVVQFVRELNEKATAAGYDEAKLARLIPLQLSGAAKIKYDNYAADLKSDYRKILDQLKKDFRSPNYVEMAKSKIYSIKQELAEDVVVFGQRVKDLVADAYAESSPTTIEEIACETFVRGLNTDLRIAIMKKRMPSHSFLDLQKLAENEQHLLEIVKRERGSLDIAMINAITEAVRNVHLAENNVNSLGYRSRNHYGNSPPQRPRDSSFSRGYQNDNYGNSRMWTRNNEWNNVPTRQPRPFYRQNRDYEHTGNNNHRGYRPRNHHNNAYNARGTFNNSGRRNNFNRDNYARNHSRSLSRNSERRVSFQDRYRSPSRGRQTRGRRVASVFNTVPSLFITITLLSIISSASAAIPEFKLCGNGKAGLPIAIPKPINCTLPRGNSPVLLAEGEIYVENMVPRKFEGIHCFNKSRIVCTSSFFHLTLNVESDVVITEPISAETCKNIARTKKYNDKPLRRLHQMLYDTGNEALFSYPILGKRCTTSSNLFVEYGDILTTDGKHMISNLGEMTTCEITNGYCTQEHGVIVWEQLNNENRFCKYVKSASSLMYISTDHVLSEKLQAVFHFGNQNITLARKQHWCIPNAAEPMLNGVFINFPNIPTNGNYSIREMMQKQPDFVKSINEKHEKATEKIKLRSLREKRSISSILHENANKTEQMLVINNGDESPEARELAKIHFMKLFSKPSFDHDQLFHEERQDQRHYELNVRTQFLSFRLQEQIDSDFRFLWSKLCALSNSQTRTISSMLQTNPSTAARILLDNDNVSAVIAGEVLLVSHCKIVNIDEIIYSNKINGKCFKHTPVRAGSKIYFLIPGSHKELTTSSYEVDCAHSPTSIVNVDGKWLTNGGEAQVYEISPSMPFNHFKEIIFSGPPIFHSEISRLSSIVAMTSKHSNAQNYGKNSNEYRSDFLNDELHKLSVEGLQYATSIEENAKDVLQSQAKFILETVSFRVIAFISSVLILVAVLFGMWICYYFSCIKIMRKLCKRTSKKQQRIETITMQKVDNDNEEENKNHATFNQNRMNTTKFLSYVPIVMSIINSAEAKTCYPCFVPVFCKETPIVALLDTGSSITFLDEKTLSHLKANITREKIPPAKAANGSEIPFIGYTQIPIVFGNQTIAQKVMITKNGFCPAPLVVGMDLLYQINAPIRFDMQRKMISIGRATIPILQDNETGYSRRIFTVTITENILIPSRSDNFVMGEIDFLFDKEVELIAEDNKSDDIPEGVIVGKTLHCPALTKQFPLRILNTSHVQIQLYKGQKIANAEITEQCSGLHKRVFSVYEDERRTPKTVDIVRNEANYVPPEVEIDYPTDTTITDGISEIEKINWEHSQLDLHQKTAVVDMVNDFRDIFISKNGEIGRYSGKIRHRIDLIENSKIPKQKPYRVPLEQRKEVIQQIQELLKQRIIEKSSSPFCAPIILVKKKDQTWRFVVDYRKLNSITKSETYVIPNIQEIIDLASGKAFYTTVDFKSGFHQIPMEKSHRERTAFQTFLGLFHFITMPMGLKGAPGTFQKVANSLIRELRSCTFAYIDDIVVCSNSFEEHLRDIRELFSRIRTFGMKLRLDKCVFAAKEVEYLGVLISKAGSRINPSKIEKILKYPVPSSVTAVKSFLGAASYFRRYIRNFAKIAEPLTRITSKHHKNFRWGDEQQKAFQELKQRLTSAPVLASPRTGHPYQIHTDASMKAVAGTLLQENPETGEIHPIAFTSRCLNKHEKNYSVIELEALAIVYSLVQFRPYVFGAKIQIVTDHSPLCSLFHRSDLSGRLAKYQVAIMGYDAIIQYRPGKQNAVSDALSRYPNETVVNSVQITELPSWEEIKDAQEASPYNERIQKLREQSHDESEGKRFSMLNDVLYYIDGKNVRLVITSDLHKEKIMRHHHENCLDGGHLGINKTLHKIRSRFYWRKMNHDIASFVRCCPVCQKVKSPSTLIRKEELGRFPTGERPYFRVHSDVIGPMQTCLNGNSYILIHTCAFTKYITCTAIPNQQTSTVAKAFVNEVVCKFGVPEELISDKGSNYTSQLFNDIAKILGMKHTFTSSYHHQSNGQVERYVKTLTDTLTCFVHESREAWSDFLQLAVFAVNTSRNETTGETPFFLMHGRDPQLISDGVLKCPRKTYFDATSYKMELIHNLTIAWKINKDRIAKMSEKYKNAYDENAVDRGNLTPGELVLLQNDENIPKLCNKWKGPYRVLEVLSPNITIQRVGQPQKKSSKEVLLRWRVPLISSITGSGPIFWRNARGKKAVIPLSSSDTGGQQWVRPKCIKGPSQKPEKPTTFLTLSVTSFLRLQIAFKTYIIKFIVDGVPVV
ncbi:integrase core domain protein [Ancylostoma duodenale]|uniref:RNA-directed DNA polymerase n=1 Tax=Ancylostoma duodenale TaxID=51022 RepID=A0A0C2CKU4_9BILA|nr:integrase core domain protein [Ancylostoma duodenale]